MIQIKTAAEIELMRAAGLVVGHTLELLKAAVEPGMTTQDLDDVAARSIRDAGAVPSFLGYHGFPGTICTSVNDEIVHGIPSPRKVLREGDIVSIDCGAIVEGYHGDAAVTVPVGRVTPELTELMRVCEGSMWAGFAAARLGGRLSDIGAAVERHVWPHGYGVVEEYVGHGIGTEMHQDPQVPNYGRPGRGPRLVQGLVLAVEPMVNLGGRHTRLLDDGWTVVTRDGRPSAHFEHTFTLTEAGPWVLTSLDFPPSRLVNTHGPASVRVKVCSKCADGRPSRVTTVQPSSSSRVCRPPRLTMGSTASTRPWTSRGPRLVQGLVLAVEPMVNLGGRHTRLLDDGWTVVTRDGRPSAHFEHTFTLTEAGPWVLTSLDGGKSRLTQLLAAPAAG